MEILLLEKARQRWDLFERGHRLISDDVVLLKGKGERRLIGSGPDLNKHLLELRGIGIVNVAHHFGAVSVRDEVPVDIVIYLEEWDETHYYDRVGLEERFTEFLGVKVPLYLHPVKPGRDTVLLIETTILNHRLKEMGYHPGKEFNQKLLEEIAACHPYYVTTPFVSMHHMRNTMNIPTLFHCFLQKHS